MRALIAAVLLTMSAGIVGCSQAADTDDSDTPATTEESANATGGEAASIAVTEDSASEAGSDAK